LNKTRKIYRQGDLILVEEEGIDTNLAMKEGDILEIASENGNTHKLISPVYSLYGRRYVVVKKPSTLIHPQHPKLVIEPGIYRVEFVRDYALNRSID
jgi:hypothetical protein